MRYLPHTASEIAAMLQQIGVSSIAELFAAIPQDKQLNRPLALESSMEEPQLMAHLQALADKNTATSMLSFLGAGIYHHHVPPTVDQLLQRSEFYTAYTPYQAEIAQGTLQAIFEFQTLVCQLFEMEVANASMYDGASATAEAVLMARRIRKQRTCLISAGLHPEYRQTIETYLRALDEGTPALQTVALASSGQTDLADLEAQLNDSVAAVVVGYPNFYGCVEELTSLKAVCKKHGALLITATAEPYALALIDAPGNAGVDIAVGEGQPLAITPQLGGPGVGLFTCRQEHLRQMPGRVVGETVDSDGQRGFVLTLSTREQHIRRERATSNICTNHGLIALAFAIRMALLGKAGFVAAARRCLNRAAYLRNALAKSDAFELPYSAPHFNELLVRCKTGTASALLHRLASDGILAGVPLARFFPDNTSDFLVAVTERHTKTDIDRLIVALTTAKEKG